MTKGKPRKPVLVLRLYVAGSAPNSLRAIESLKAACEEQFAGCHEVEIVDLLQHPRRGLADGIIVTPTLLKLAPKPQQRLIGNLGDAALLLLTLGGK
jgi:circadian clock protein KaiB